MEFKSYGLVVSDKSDTANRKGQKVCIAFNFKEDAIGKDNYAHHHGLDRIGLTIMN
ncbi:MAG: hypothetical protein L6N94_01585 [Candidatus Methylarchaceae archaeon HK01M]|nr:hypothetical protein [Candidatus Methylarchaceae archaeon HK01M]